MKLNCIYIVSSFFPFKDQIPLMMSFSIIYKYSCGQCQSSYIGETHRHFISRICEHKGISPRTKKTNVNSNIREHSLSCDHPIIIVIIYIHKLSPNLNNHNSSCPLNILN